MAVQRYSVDTRDTGETLQALARAFGPIQVRRDEDVFGFTMSGAIAPDLVSTRMWFDAICRTAFDQRDAAEETQQYIAGLSSGRVSIIQGRTALDTRRPTLIPDVVRTEIAGGGYDSLALPRTVVQRHAAAFTGDDDHDFRFTGATPVSPEADRTWRSAAAHVATVLGRDHGDDPPDLLMASTVGLVATLMLQTFPNTALDRLNAETVRRPPYASTRRAVTFIEEHLHQSIGVAEIAHAAGLTARGLDAAFRRDLDVTPLQLLRRLRLEAARRDLVAADSGQDSVATVARRWGFAHLGRFSATYRAAFGENPGQTLRS